MPGRATFDGLAAILRAGTVVAVMATGGGLAWAVTSGVEGRSDGGVLELIGAGGPDALIGAGLLGLALVPIAALTAALVAFGRAGEQRAAREVALVLVLVLASLGIAVVIGAPGG